MRNETAGSIRSIIENGWVEVVVIAEMGDGCSGTGNKFKFARRVGSVVAGRPLQETRKARANVAKLLVQPDSVPEFPGSFLSWTISQAH